MESLIYKPIEDFVEKQTLDGTEFIAVSATEKINLLEQLQLNTPTTDITTAYPLETGQYYTLTTALSQVEESIKKLGMEISFVRKVNTEFYHEAYKFIGQTLSEFDDTSKWKLQQSYEYGNFLDYYKELFFGNSGNMELTPIGNGQLDIITTDNNTVETRFDFESFKDYYYIPRGFIFKTQLVLKSVNNRSYTSRVNIYLNSVNIGDFVDLHEDSAQLFPSDSIQNKSYISFYNSNIYIKPGDVLTFVLVVRKNENSLDTVSVFQTTEIPAMVSFFDKSYYKYIIKKSSPPQVTTTGFLLTNPLLEPDFNYLENNNGLDNLWSNGGGFLKWNKSTLQLYLTGSAGYSDGALKPNELPHRLFLQNTGSGDMTITLSITQPYSVPGILKSTFGDTYVLEVGKSIFIKYQWYHDNGEMICLLDKSADFVKV